MFVLLSLTLVAIAMSFVWGWLADRQGPEADAGLGPDLVGGRPRHRRGRDGVRAGRVRRSFLVAGAILGSGLGGVQVADRVLMVRLSPPDRIGEFFGIYGLVGKGSQVDRPDAVRADPLPAPRLARATARTRSRS